MSCAIWNPLILSLPVFFPAPSPLALVSGCSFLLAILFWISLKVSFLRRLIGPPDDFFLGMRHVPYLWHLLMTVIALLAQWSLQGCGVNAKDDFMRGIVWAGFLIGVLLTFQCLHPCAHHISQHVKARFKLQQIRSLELRNQ